MHKVLDVKIKVIVSFLKKVQICLISVSEKLPTKFQPNVIFDESPFIRKKIDRFQNNVLFLIMLKK